MMDATQRVPNGTSFFFATNKRYDLRIWMMTSHFDDNPEYSKGSSHSIERMLFQYLGTI
jgi:hypothetical protein